MKADEILSFFGLNDSESAVYVACLELGTATASDIAKRAGVKRTYFYDIAKTLNSMGLLSCIEKNNKKIYSATDPEKLREIQNDRSKKLDELLPELKAVYNTSGKKPKVRFFDGLDGIKEVNKDTLKHRGEIFGFTTEHFLNAEGKKLSREYIQGRVERGVYARVFGEATRELIDVKRNDKEELRETKVLPPNLFHSNIEFIIYGNKIAISSYQEEFGMIIESADITEPLKMLFELIWRGGFVIDKKLPYRRNRE